MNVMTTDDPLSALSDSEFAALIARLGDPGLGSLLDTTPVDLAAVQRDEALLSGLGKVGSLDGDADADLAQVLLGWRRAIDPGGSLPQLVDVDTALAVISAALAPSPRRRPLLAPLAAAAAVLVVAFSAVSLASTQAQPGDRLWPLTQLLYAEHARAVESTLSTREALREADVALRDGEIEQARRALDRAGAVLGGVDDPRSHAELAGERARLTGQLDLLVDAR